MWTKLDAWVRDLLVDPFSKEPLTSIPMTNGVPDFRRKLFVGKDAEVWKEGQEHYEEWAEGLGRADAEQDYDAEIDGLREVYAEIPLSGRVLDVGGHQGRARYFLEPDQEYVSCDPYINLFTGVDRQPNLLKKYPCLSQPLNFVSAHAEHLPFRSQGFDTVHMRSCIDHFLDPALALMEAFRVVRPKGKLVVGLYVEGGKKGRVSPLHPVKEAVRDTLGRLGVDRYIDLHVWHPTYAQLCELIEAVGFKIARTHWQKNTNESVCYIESHKT